jgi:glycosyltransferase involved in cell wall biosynthesis
VTTVSVCIRGSRPGTAPEAVESVLSQGWRDIEVLVGDEHGTLAEVIERFGDPRVRRRPFDAPPGPRAHARTLMNEARGRYLVLMDDDDWWLPGFLDATVSRLDADPSLGVVFTNFFHGVRDTLCARETAFAEGRHERFLTAFLRGEAPIGVSFAVLRREVWEDGERAHPLREDAPVDTTLWLRSAQAGWPFYFVRARLGVYRLHANQMSLGGGSTLDRGVGVWEAFRFEDPEAETLRRRRLREAYLERANLYLRRRRLPDAVVELRAARAAFPKRFGVRDALALLGIRRGPQRLMARSPRVARLAFAAWPVLTRFDQWPRSNRRSRR